MFSRRAMLGISLLAGAAACAGGGVRAAFAAAPTDRRLVVVILRGGLDGLAAVPPHGDRDYARLRGDLALMTRGEGALVDLDGFFGLHPALPAFKSMWDARELAIFHNIATPYRDRSHFDAQNVLETGGRGPHVLHDGWLNRALGQLALDGGTGALAVAPAAPLILLGAAKTTTWMPAALPPANEDFLGRVRALYAHDAVLGDALARALETREMAGGTAAGAMGGARGYNNFAPLAEGAGRLLAADEGPRIAVLESGGWDTHFNQGVSAGVLGRQLTALDGAMAALRTALGAVWTKTAVVVVTEFGRTAAPNGTGGTDHGTAGAAFLLGGAVAGGSVHAEWTGLAGGALHEGRDQPPRTDMRALFKAVLGDHMRVAQGALGAHIFPDSGAVAPIRGLFRT